MTGPGARDTAARQHHAACLRFSDAVAAADVIGFHDVLLSRPFNAKPDRPRDDPVRRGSVTVEAGALARTGMYERPVAIPNDADAPTRLLAHLGRDLAWQPERGPAGPF